ncbi:hypothetical protein A2U01_0064713, partial [Trifolium medium]|nr:hypothetical protein [Trifolium medium]
QKYFLILACDQMCEAAPANTIIKAGALKLYSQKEKYVPGHYPP